MKLLFNTFTDATQLDDICLPVRIFDNKFNNSHNWLQTNSRFVQIAIYYLYSECLVLVKTEESNTHTHTHTKGINVNEIVYLCQWIVSRVFFFLHQRWFLVYSVPSPPFNVDSKWAQRESKFSVAGATLIKHSCFSCEIPIKHSSNQKNGFILNVYTHNHADNETIGISIGRMHSTFWFVTLLKKMVETLLWRIHATFIDGFVCSYASLWAWTYEEKYGIVFFFLL